MTRAVYDTLLREAEYLLALGHGVVLDATFNRPAERDRVAEMAAAVEVPFTGVWLELAPEALIERVERRGEDVSDATASVVRDQIARFRGPMTWTAVSGEGSVETVAARVRALIGAD